MLKNRFFTGNEGNYVDFILNTPSGEFNSNMRQSLMTKDENWSLDVLQLLIDTLEETFKGFSRVIAIFCLCKEELCIEFCEGRKNVKFCGLKILKIAKKNF